MKNISMRLVGVAVALGIAMVIVYISQNQQVGPKQINSPDPKVGLIQASRPPTANTTTTAAAERRDNDRSIEIRDGVRFIYRRAISGLQLNPRDEEKTWEYLFRRTEAGHIAKQVAEERGELSRLRDIIKEAQRQVDEEMKGAVSPELFQKLQILVSASLYINELNQSYSRAFEASGEPISDTQLFLLASAFMATYGTPGNPRTDPTRSQLDAHGLTLHDREMLSEANKVLNGKQVETLKGEIVRRNARLANSRS